MNAPLPSREELTAERSERFTPKSKRRPRPAPEPRGPWANVPYTLEIDGARASGTTGADGTMALVIPPNAKKGTLVLAAGGPHERRMQLELGHMDPVLSDRGVRQRLQNLGFLPSTDEEPPPGMLESALLQFQRAQSLPTTGAVDQATRDRLVVAYGS